MDSSEERFESLSRNIEEHEKKVRRRVWISALVPLFLGLFFLGYTIWQIRVYGQQLTDVQGQLSDTSNELGLAITSLQDTQARLNQADTDIVSVKAILDQTTKDLENTRQELDQTKKELQEATQELKNANVFVANSVTVDILGEKGDPFQLSYPSQAYLLANIQNLQLSGVNWNLNGFSVSEGFNSPNFAVYILQASRHISSDYGADAKPWQFLIPVDRPSIGDIIYYEGGYTMFYFVINGQEFVIGMTPIGIISQKPNFAPILGYLQVPYP